MMSFSIDRAPVRLFAAKVGESCSKSLWFRSISGSAPPVLRMMDSFVEVIEESCEGRHV